MLKARFARIGVVLCALVATAATSVLPAAHVHTSISGLHEVHRHVVEHPDDHHEAAVNHGNHRDLRTLEPTFVSERHFSFAPPLPSVGPVLAPRGGQVVGRVASFDVPLAHSPPLRFASLRAPPA